MDDDSRLQLHPVEVVWGREETLLVRGLPAGSRVVTSTVSPPIAGTLLRAIEEEDAAPSEGSAGAGDDDEAER